MAKQLCKAIKSKAWVTDTEVSDFFDDEEHPTDAVLEEREAVEQSNHPLPTVAASHPPPTIVSTIEHWSSVGSSGHISRSIAASVQSSTFQMKQNQLISTIETSFKPCPIHLKPSSNSASLQKTWNRGSAS